MSQFPKTARHPDIILQAVKWSALQNSINISDESQLSDISDLSIDARNVQVSGDSAYSSAAREIVGAGAVRALAKSYEALDALEKCAREGVNVSAMIQAYNASYFAARAFCMLIGFGPLNRDSSITVDVFFEASTGKSKRAEVAEVLRLYKYGRWGHEEVWNLTRRLIDTSRVPEDLEHSHGWLKRAKLSESQKVRNSFSYDDSRLAPVDDCLYVDFPDVVKLSIFDGDAPSEFVHQFFVAKHLIQICSFILARAGFEKKLRKYVSQRRLRILFDCVQRRP